MRRIAIAAMATLIVTASCQQEKDGDQEKYSISDLSGTYKLTYVGPDSKAVDSNLQEYCGETYHVIFRTQGKTAREYSIYSKDTLHLFNTNFKDYVIINNAQGIDTIAGYELVNPSTYRADAYGKADSLLIGDASIRYRSALFHPGYFLIHIAGKDYNNQKLYFRFERYKKSER